MKKTVFLAWMLGFLTLTYATGCQSAKPCIEPIYGAGVVSVQPPVKPQEPVKPIEPPVVVNPTPVPEKPPIQEMKPPAKPQDVALAEETIARMKNALPAFRVLASTSSMEIDMPSLEQSVTAKTNMEKAHAIYTSYRATALNIEGARSLVTQDSFYVYNRLEKELIYGPLNLAGTFMPISGTVDEIIAVITGTMIPDAKQVWHAAPKSDQIMTLTNDARTVYYEVDRQSWRVTHFEVRNSSGQATETVTFAEPEQFEGMWFPRRVEMQQPSAQRYVKIYHRSFTRDAESATYDLNVDRKKVALRLIR